MTVQETVYLYDTPVAVIKQTKTGSPATVTTTVHYAFADQIDTVRVIARASDLKMVWRWDAAEPFGISAPDENPASLGAFGYDPRFPGQIYDRETNLHYNHHRDYDPVIGRYVQSDPIGLAAGINTYAYVASAPTTLTDPTGQNPVGGAAIGGAIGGPIGSLIGGVIGACVVAAGIVMASSPNDRQEKCWAAYQAQIEVCKLTSHTKKARAQCYARAADVYGDCLAGRN